MVQKKMTEGQIRPHVPARAAEVELPAIETISNFCKRIAVLVALVPVEKHSQKGIKDVIEQLNSTKITVRKQLIKI
jgi:hypothetical protein